jgi:hypothetical protein
MANTRKKPGKPRTAGKGDVVEFEIDERPYHATGTIVDQDSFNPRHEPRYKIRADNKETYWLYRFEFKVVG